MSNYILINILAVAAPLLLSFDRKVHFYKRWKYLFPSILLTMMIFIPWDILFTSREVWGFNPRHICGFTILGLPPGEWLFFITVPYASVFIYDVFKYYLIKSPFEKISRNISIFLLSFLIILALLSYDKAYTFTSFILLALVISYLEFVKKVQYLAWFYFSYIVILAPFLLVNGILTGSWIEEEVVWYNNAENLSIRIFTIPVEDVFYGMLLILLNVSFYEWFQKRKIKNIQSGLK